MRCAARRPSPFLTRWLTWCLAWCLLLALPLQGLAAATGLPGCPHRAALQQLVEAAPCHQAADVAAAADTADTEESQGLACAACLACTGGVAFAPAHGAIAAPLGNGIAPAQHAGQPARPGFAHGLERPPRAG